MSSITQIEGEIVSDGLSQVQVALLNKFRLISRRFQSATGTDGLFTLQQIEQVIKNDSCLHA